MNFVFNSLQLLMVLIAPISPQKRLRQDLEPQEGGEDRTWPLLGLHLLFLSCYIRFQLRANQRLLSLHLLHQQRGQFLHLPGSWRGVSSQTEAMRQLWLSVSGLWSDRVMYVYVGEQKLARLVISRKRRKLKLSPLINIHLKLLLLLDYRLQKSLGMI